MLGEEHPDTLTGIANLASTYRDQGRWKEAEELFMRVMETSLRVLGEEHPDTLTSMANLASTYREQGRWKEGEELFVRVIETSLRVLGEEHPETLTTMNNLAITWKRQGMCVFNSYYRSISLPDSAPSTTDTYDLACRIR